jgi:ABC-type glycerol-3-phosphate transport system substrate-binding protein
MKRFALALAAATLLIGCGGGDSTTTAGDSTTPRTDASTTTTSTTGAQRTCCGFPERTVEAVLTARGPALGCGVRVTVNYVKSSYGGEQGCIAALRAGSAVSAVDVKSVDQHGRRATVKAVPADGPNGGETLTISLVYQRISGASTWRVDAIRSNVPVGP